jgi:membrane protein DedA with SNARE-associated domain
MPLATSQLGALISQYGYAAVFALVLGENVGLPIPGETSIMLAGAAAAAGRLNPIVIWVLATVAAIIGDNALFAVGHYGGEPFLKRYGRWFRIDAQALEATGRFFDSYGGPAVMAARFIPIVRVVAPLTASSSGMRWQKFLPWQAGGAALWAAFGVTVGFFGEGLVKRFEPLLVLHLGRYWPLVIAGTALLTVAAISLISHAVLRRVIREREGA